MIWGGHVKQVKRTSETLAIDSVVDERGSHNAVNKEGISAEMASADLTSKRRGGGEENLDDHRNKSLTHISRSTTGCGHDTARSLDL